VFLLSLAHSFPVLGGAGVLLAFAAELLLEWHCAAPSAAATAAASPLP